MVSLCWQPGAARLTVVLLKARNLPRMDVTGLADPYVKIYLLMDGKRIAKKKTHVKKRTLSPVFNESFAFDIPTNEVCIVKVFSYNFDIYTILHITNDILFIGHWSKSRKYFIGVDVVGLGPCYQK